jgi:hypothetical protein
MTITTGLKAKREPATAENEAQGWEIEWFGRLDSVDSESTPLCELPELAAIGENTDEKLSVESMTLLGSLEKWMAPCVGAASFRELRESWASALRWAQRKHDPERGSFAAFARSVVWTKAQQFRRRYTRVALHRELRDEELRREALRGDANLAKYLHTGQLLMAQAQRAFPRRWYIPGMTEEDVRGELSIRLLEHVRSGRPWEPYERVGRAATFVFCDRGRRSLKKRRQIYELTESGFTADDLVSHAPSPEDMASTASTAAYLRGVYEAAAQKMSKTQRTWFHRMRADVAWHGDLNEARVADQLERSRSAASRAKDAVRDVIAGELGVDFDDDLVWSRSTSRSST